MCSYLFVDGSNLYAGQYELFGPKKYLDFSKYIKRYLINEYNFYKRERLGKNVIFLRVIGPLLVEGKKKLM